MVGLGVAYRSPLDGVSDTSHGTLVDGRLACGSATREGVGAAREGVAEKSADLQGFYIQPFRSDFFPCADCHVRPSKNPVFMGNPKRFSEVTRRA